MTQMQDTEGAAIPKDETGRTYFDADLCDWNDGTGPDLTINAPAFFEGEDGTVYNSHGVIYVSLRAVLEDYLVNFKSQDGGDGVPAFAEWLRDYANRIEADTKEPA